MEKISIHALREEGDPVPEAGRPGADISIHALREEGDVVGSVQLVTKVIFLSTPSARRATRRSHHFYGHLGISIHALREEGDLDDLNDMMALCEFLSTPSARRATRCDVVDLQVLEISIHALREEGDAVKLLLALHIVLFLSTPSARRATAKTETKSLFSYKLYNILHEFRRALIYNGSKNDPNHAKRHKNPVRRCRKNAENSPFAPGRETQNNSRPSCSKGG